MTFEERQQLIVLIARIAVSAVIIVICAIILLGNYDDSRAKWAYGLIGVVVGYWLR